MQNKSETVVGACLKKHPLESFYLATKFPGHMLAENDYLKNLQALVLEDERRQRRKRR